MERNNAIYALISIIIKRRQAFKAKLALVLARWRNNIEIISAITAVNNNIMQKLVAIEQSKVRRRRMWKIDRKGTFWESDVPKMEYKMFKDNFRVSKESFAKICENVIAMTRRDTVMRNCIPLNKRVAIALYALGSSAEYRTVAHLFGVGRSTVGEIVLEFCETVCGTFGNYISSYPPTEQELKRVVEGFKTLGFPQSYGALDGCQIEMQPKQDEAVDYYNYKGWYSTILLAACDHRSKFTYINVGSAGRNNDSYIFERSSLKRFHEGSDIFRQNSKEINNIDVPVLLIGDSAFRLSQHMMKPYPFKTNQSETQKIFNYRLSKCRRVIENAFGQLKARFRKIGRGLEVEPRNCDVIIRACCLLHNFLKEEEDDVSNLWIEEAQTLSIRTQPISTTRVGDNNLDGKSIRDAIASSFENDNEFEDDILGENIPEILQ